MDKKEAIRRAAIKVMAKEGFVNTKMQSIANKAGIAIGTIYLYFKNKESILDFIFMIEYEKKIKYIDILKKDNMPYLHQINSFLVFLFNEMKKSPNSAKVLAQESINPELRKLKWVKKTYQDIPDILSQMLDDAKKNGEIRDIDSNIIGSTIYLSSQALAYKMLKEGRESEYEFALEQFILFTINGIMK